MTDKRVPGRLDGLDFARFVAFVGMVIVNFKIVMGATSAEDSLLGILTSGLEGRAAATFVVLAGVGLGLAANRSKTRQTIIVTLKRALFLLVMGLLNSLIFDADILHYYAFYFLFGVFCLPLSSRALVWLIVLANIVFLGMMVVLDYNTGWNWSTFYYADFWTLNGFVRNLFFNGWHPVFPWLGFLLFGIVLSRMRLGETSRQNRMIVLGIAAFMAVELVSAFLVDQLANGDAEIGLLLGTGPIPPMPLYMLAGMSIGAVVIGICLRASDWLARTGVLEFVTPAGRQTLTLYIAHILIGMGVLEAAGMIGGQSLPAAFGVAVTFCVLSVIYAYLWSKAFKRGPIEAVMRKLAA